MLYLDGEEEFVEPPKSLRWSQQQIYLYISYYCCFHAVLFLSKPKAKSDCNVHFREKELMQTNPFVEFSFSLNNKSRQQNR